MKKVTLAVTLVALVGIALAGSVAGPGSVVPVMNGLVQAPSYGGTVAPILPRLVAPAPVARVIPLFNVFFGLDNVYMHLDNVYMHLDNVFMHLDNVYMHLDPVPQRPVSLQPVIGIGR